MDSLSINDLIKSCKEKDVRLQTLKLKVIDSENKELFDVGRMTWNSINMSFNTDFTFCIMNDRMQISGSELFNYFAKCLAPKALAEWYIATPFFILDYTNNHFRHHNKPGQIDTYLPQDTFLFQKQWMSSILKKKINMKVKEFGTNLWVLNHLLKLFSHTEGDRIFSDNMIKTIYSWMQYLLYGDKITFLRVQEQKTLQGIGRFHWKLSIQSWYRWS